MEYKKSCADFGFSHFGNSHTFFDRQLLLIGNSTLYIYIYHYFFIRFINLEFLKVQSLPIETAVTASFAIAITYGSIFVGKSISGTFPKSV